MTDSEGKRVGRVDVQGENDTLVIERRLSNPPEAVWEAISDPEQIAKWYMTKATIDGRVGGEIDFKASSSQFNVSG